MIGCSVITKRVQQKFTIAEVPLIPGLRYCIYMAVRLGKYSQSLCISMQKYMLCTKILVVLHRNKKIFVVLHRNKVIAQKYLYTCMEISSVHGNVSCAPKSWHVCTKIHLVVQKLLSHAQKLIDRFMWCAEIFSSAAKIIICAQKLLGPLCGFFGLLPF